MNTETEEQKREEVGVLLSKASGIVRVIGLGRFDYEAETDIQAAAWSAYNHIDEARKLLGVDGR